MKALRAVLLAVLLLAAPFSVPAPGGGMPAGERPRTVTCSFSNPSYSGYCKQTAALPPDGSAEEVCRGILKCLNDVRCIQTYCNATTIRGNWKLELVETSGEKK